MHQGYKPRLMRLHGGRPKELRDFNVRLQVDWDRLYRDLGTRAAGNKSRKAIGMSGAVIVTVEPR